MSQPAKRVPGCDYLYERGRRFVVRVQVPRELKLALGKGEFKKSLGGDLALAKRKYHNVVATILAQIETARALSLSGCAVPSASTGQPTFEDLDIACHAHFVRMAKNMRGKVAEPIGDDPRTVKNRAEGFRVMIENMVHSYALETWSDMSLDATWLCEEHGWVIPPGSSMFEHLCRLMLRARLQCYRNELRRLEGKIAADPDADPMFGALPPKRLAPPLALGDLIDKFTASREAKWSASTARNYIIINRLIEEVCDRQTPLDHVDDEFCMSVRDVLLRLPANYQKHPAMKGRPIPEVVEIAAAKGLPLIGPATINGHLTKLAAIIRFGREKGWITGNPMAGIDVPDPIDPSEKRHPFITEHLNAIFSTEPWSSVFDPADPRPSRYWAPLIALYSGARLTDICGQLVEEILEQDGVRLLNFVHRPGERHIKSGKSRRVPIHTVLIELGFWDFVEQARNSGRRQLFPDVKRDLIGKWGDNTSKWFSRKIKHLGLKGRNLSFHSFRHSFEDALRRVDLHDTPVGNAIAGRWSAGSSKNYGTKYPLEKLRDAIELVSYPGFQRPHID